MATRSVEFAGYQGCIELSNGDTTTVVGPHCGGRALSYSLGEQEALMLDPDHDGYTWEPGGPRPALLCPSGGRFDIGPEQIIPPHPELWLGAWEAGATGPLSVMLTSQTSPSTGVQLQREFSLAASGSRLTCTQTMTNRSDETTRWCYWGRTFGRGHGIAVVPLTPELSRMPSRYVMYNPDRAIQIAPDDPAIRIREGCLEVWDTPAHPKLGIDSYAGWFAYLMPHGHALVKRYPTYPDRVYGELAGLTLSLWYYRDVVCELEPIGPTEVLGPGTSASFTEEWWLVPFGFPSERSALDIAALTNAAQAAMV